MLVTTRTTQLYDRRTDDVTLDEVEGMIFGSMVKVKVKVKYVSTKQHYYSYQ